MTARPPTVLVADDDPSFHEMVAGWLEADGFAVVPALDGARACELAEASPPDLVLLDLLLPRLDGYGVLLSLRGHAATARVPVLVVSGEARGDHAPIAESLGARGYLEKPFGRDELLRAVRAALEART